MPAGVTGCPTDMDCSNYFCISSAMSKNWKKAGKRRFLQCHIKTMNCCHGDPSLLASVSSLVCFSPKFQYLFQKPDQLLM